MLTCEELPARIEARPDDVTEAQMQGTKVAEKPYLEVSPAYAPSRTVEYCSAADPAFKDDLLRRLVRVSK
jgi:hypothetical protein